MERKVKGIPDGVPVVTPRLFCRDPVAEIEFCATTFAAVELNRRQDADGNTAHALMTIGPAMIMIESEWPQVANRAPSPDGSSPVALYVYVRVDDAVAPKLCIHRDISMLRVNESHAAIEHEATERALTKDALELCQLDPRVDA